MKIIAVLALTFFVTAAQADCPPRHHMVVFGTEGVPHEEFRIIGLRNFLDAAAKSHTFATFVETRCDRVTAEHTISWMPKRGYFAANYEMPHPGIYPGYNYPLDATLELSRGKHIKAWGPYPISDALWKRALHRVEYLNTPGAAEYKMVLPIREFLREPALRDQSGAVINSIMAVSDIGGYQNTDKAYGFEATAMVVGRLMSLRHVGREHDADVAHAMSLLRRIDDAGVIRGR